MAKMETMFWDLFEANASEANMIFILDVALDFFIFLDLFQEMETTRHLKGFFMVNQ